VAIASKSARIAPQLPVSFPERVGRCDYQREIVRASQFHRPNSECIPPIAL
jgi:hypothetical protein